MVAPVTYMWRPVFSQEMNLKLDAVDLEHRATASFRQLWVWIHASAFGEGYDVLKLACHKEVHFLT